MSQSQSTYKALHSSCFDLTSGGGGGVSPHMISADTRVGGEEHLIGASRERNTEFASRPLSAGEWVGPHFLPLGGLL